MPSANIVVETDIESTFRVQQVAALYDVSFGEKSKESWDVNIPIENTDWRIGLILGPSGSGKTTIGKQLFGESAYHTGFEWPENKAVVDGFDKKFSIKEVCGSLTAVGFGSTPNWSRPFRVLSNGEKFRSELARILLEGPSLCVIDEFTSVVDRTVAKVGSSAVHKAVNRSDNGRQYIMLSCHYDIAEWLRPDWIYDLSNNAFTRRCLRRPDIKLEIYRTHHKTWGMFAKYHYLTSKMHVAAQSFIVLWEDKPVAFRSYLPVIGYKGMIRGSRLVVLPDYQGVGIGAAVLDKMADYYKQKGYRVRDKASHPGLVSHWSKSPLWKVVGVQKVGNAPHTIPGLQTSKGRAAVTVEYVGDRGVA